MLQYRSWSIVVLSMMALSLVLTACATPTPEVVREQVTTEVEVTKVVRETVKETQVVTPTPEPVPEEESEIIIAHPGPIYTMDAPVTWYGSTHYLTMMLYDCMIWRERNLDGYVPHLANDWENVEPNRWRFHIREGATFHNGEPINAETIKWNIERVKSRDDFMVSGQWQFVDEVELVDEYTLDIVTTTPDAYALYNLSFNGCEVLPPEYLQEVGEEEFARNPIGSGPYELVEFTEGERYVFEAFDDYWAGRPAIDRVIYQVIPERASQVAALLAGQVDMIADVPMSQRDVVDAGDETKVVKAPPAWAHQLRLRDETEHGAVGETYPDFTPTTENMLIRQAISHALDRTLLAEIQGSATPTLAYLVSVWPEVPEELVGEEAADAWYDPDRARELIREAGYDPEGGNKPHLYFDAPAFDQGGEKEVAEAAQLMLEDVGFEVDLKIWDIATYKEQVMRPGNNRDMYMVTTGKGPSILIMQFRCDWAGSDYVCREDLDPINDAIRTEMDEEARLELWEEWWDWYVEDAVSVTLYEIHRFYGMNARLDWEPRADGWISPRDARLTQ